MIIHSCFVCDHPSVVCCWGDWLVSLALRLRISRTFISMNYNWVV